MIHSIIQILVFQILFLAVYDLFLKKETFFGINRIYLLLTSTFGFVLPFISLGFIQKNIPQEYIIQLPAVVVGNNISDTILSVDNLWMPSLIDVWIVGAFVSTLFFFLKLYKILKLKRTGKTEKCAGFNVVILPKTDTAFSFFSTIFLGEHISKETKVSIIAHEKIHIEERHTLDLLFFEILRILVWFNPMIYLFQSRITILHEYIADAKVTAQKDKKQYYQNLLSEVFQTEKISFINTFFNQSLIKKRIRMLQKSKSRKTAQLKYLLILPIICGMLVYTACSDAPKVDETQIVSQSDSEVMTKINELAEAIMKKGDMTAEEEKALKFLTTKAEPGDKVYSSVQEYLDENKEANTLDVPFSAIEKVPTYPGCSGDREAMKKCFSENIAAFVNTNFNIKLADKLNLSGQQRIAVQFKVDNTGRVTDVRARAPKPELEAEAIRVIKMLPQMEAGEQKGEKVGVLYSLPIIFEVK
ncbi:M56 family metallopeptidase [Aequorivita sp. Q41]|uniref:M56 family metallopeptidase n=1 Tax=Aequorivita sp. Q41 TaxID=3153300 RepID=UPI0032427BA1